MKPIFMAALAAGTIAIPSLAQAQVNGIATANPIIAIAGAKALQRANQQIQTTYKSYMDQIQAKLEQRQTLLLQLDKNKDKNVDDAELKAAKVAKSPALKQLDTIEAEIERLNGPRQKAMVYAIESLLKQYDAAQTKVITDRRIGVILKPDSFVYAPQAADVTTAITAALDQLVPTVPVTPPANWQPSQTAVSVYEQILQLQQLAAQRGPAPAVQPQQPAPQQPQQPQPQPPQGR